MGKSTTVPAALSQRGLGLIEVLISVAILSIIGLGFATMQAQQAVQAKILMSQTSKSALGAAIRTQLSRRAFCASSFVVPPTNWGAENEVGVRLGPTAGDPVVRAQADPQGWEVRIASFRVARLAPFGTANNGNAVFIGDLILRTATSQLGPDHRMGLAEFIVAKMTFEVAGNSLVSCYASDPLSDTTQQLEQVCGMTISKDNEPGQWKNGKCVVMDAKAQTTCADMGGNWENERCFFRRGTVGAGCHCIPYNNNVNCQGAAGGTWSCWGGASPGGTCPQDYARHDTGYVAGGPTGFICVGL